MMNKIITSEGNVQFQTADGKIINVHPFHIYTVFNEDTVSFLLIAMPKSSGLAIFTSKAEDLEVDGTVYTIEQLPNALSEAFAKAGAVARYEIVDELPTSGQSNTIYLVPKSEGIGYDEYIYVNGEWELIGDTDIELDRYVDKETFSGYTADTLVLINTVSGNVITESERAISAETALQAAIDNEISARTADVEALSGTVDNVISDLASEVSRAESAETSLSGAIDTEIAAREAADSVISGAVDTLSTDLSNEVQRAISAETALDGKIEIVSGQVISESERAISAETDLQTAINEEASARTADVEALSGAVDNVQDEVDILSAALEEETSARTDADSALTEAINAVDSKVDTLSGEVETMGDEAIVDAEYISSSTTIDFYNASGDVVAQVDATDFIIDGMVDDVRIENGYLVIEFNTDSGKQDISIPLTDIFDPSNYYDKTAIDGIVSGINESIDTVSGDVITEASARTDADTALGNKIDGKVVELTQSEYDSLVDKDPLVLYIITDAQAGDLTQYWTSAQTNSAITAAVSGKQDTLISGTNIKTINNESILGSGNIDIQGGGVDVVQTTGTSTTDVMSQDAVTTQLNNKANKTAAVGGYKFGNISGVNYLQYINVSNDNIGSSIYYPNINGKGILTTNSIFAQNNYNFQLVETSAITTSVSISSTDAQIPSAKAVYDAIQGGGGGGGTVDQTIISGSTNAVAGGAVYNKIDEVEQVTAAALNNINDRLSEDEEVTAAGLNAVNDKFDGLQLKKLTQQQYDALTVKDPNTLYVII